MEARPETSFAEEVCLPFLRNAQNKDGGWGFHPKSESRVEPTCWALQALGESSDREAQDGRARGLQFLRAAQLIDGSWPSTPEQKSGCWVTALSCWVLAREDSSPALAAVGLQWLSPPRLAAGLDALATFPRQVLFRTRTCNQSTWRSVAAAGRREPSSWVEPTSFSADQPKASASRPTAFGSRPASRARRSSAV